MLSELENKKIKIFFPSGFVHTVICKSADPETLMCKDLKTGLIVFYNTNSYEKIEVLS